MSNLVTVNSGSAIDGSLKAGRVAISTDSTVNPSSGGKTWYNMINPAEGYVFISDPKVQGYTDGSPIIYPTQTTLPSDILATINGLPDRVGSVPFDNVWDALVWVQSTGKYFILDKTLNGVPSDSLAYYVDFSNISSYPESGSVIYPLSNPGGVGQADLQNGVGYDETEKALIFDGVDDQIPISDSNNFGNLTWSNGLSVMVTYKVDPADFTSNGQYRSFLGVSSGTRSFNYYLRRSSAGNLQFHFSALGYGGLSSTYAADANRYYSGIFVQQSNGSGAYYLNNTYYGAHSGVTPAYSSTSTQYIGRADNFTAGNIAKVAIYNKPLSTDEQNSLYFGSSIVTNSLKFSMDAGHLVSYPKTGTTMYSLTGSYTGTLTNGVEYNKDFGGSFYFDGTNDYIDTNYPLNGSNAFSVSCWFKLDRVDKNWQSVVDAYLNSTDRNFQLWVNNNAKLYVYHLGASHSGAGELFPNVWYNAVFTYEGSGNGVLYLNGEVLEASVPKGAGSGGNVNVDIGRRTDANASSYTDGNISTVKIYDRALTSTEVTQNYNAERPRFVSSRDITKEGLVLDLDAGNPNSYLSGTTWNDLSGNTNNGTLNNGVEYTTDNGGALVWDGADDTVSLGNLGTIGNTQTVAVWFNSSVVENYRNVLDMNYSTYSPTTGNTGPRLEQRTGGNLNWVWSGNTTNNNIYNSLSTGVIIPNTWYHAVFVQNSGNVSLYLNGVLANTNSSPNGYLTTYGDVVIGRGFALDPSRYFAGKESSVKIYNKALSSWEVQNLYTNTAPRHRVQIPRSITDSLVLNLDAGDTTSYPRTGTTWHDRSGNGNNGTLTNGPSYLFENGGIINFDGTDDIIICGNVIDVTTGELTLETWFKLDTLGAYQVLLQKGNPGIGSNPGYRLRVENDNKLAFVITSTPYSETQIKSGTTLSANTWYHVIATRNGSQMKIYLNGDLNTSGTGTSGTLTNSNNLVIGRADGGSWPLDGKIALTKIYNKALTLSEVLENYKSTRSRFGVDGIPTSNLILHWDASNLDSYDGSSTTIYDLSGNGHHGTLYNGVGYSSVNGGVLTFDGVDDYVRSTTPDLRTTDCTIIGISRYVDFKTSGTYLGGRIINADSNNWLMGHWNRSAKKYYAQGWVTDSDGTEGYPDTNWHFYHTFNKPSTDQWTFYIDNVLDTGPSNAGSQGPNGFVIGRYMGNSTEYSISNFSTLLVYDTILSDSDVTQIYNYFRNRFGLD